jgi:hypothetical protein
VIERRASRFLTIFGAFGATLLMCNPVFAEQDDAGFSTTQTNRVVETLKENFEYCREQKSIYLPDCYQKSVAEAAKILDFNASYREAEVALSVISRDAYTFVRANLDSSAPRAGSFFFRLKGVKAASLSKGEALIKASFAKAAKSMNGLKGQKGRALSPIAKVLAEEARKGW